MAMQSSSQLYQLDQPALQKAGTWQCWWLSLLEVARATDKLNSIFKEEGGKLYAYYKTGGRSVPVEGCLPEDFVLEKPKLEVYGPEWQRMIMFFLWDKSNECPWHIHTDTLPTSQRKAELEKLLSYLGVTGITFGTPRNLIEINVSGVVNGLSNNQRVLVDKTNHAMSGIIIQPEGSNQEAYNKIKVFNQQTQQTFMCWVREHPKDKKLTLLSESGNTQLNWILPLTIN